MKLPNGWFEGLLGVLITYTSAFAEPASLPPRPESKPKNIDCLMTESNLMSQYLLVEKDGDGYLVRTYLDKRGEESKRCVATFPIKGLEPKGERYMIHFGTGTYKEMPH